MTYAWVLLEETNGNIRVFDDETLALTAFQNKFAEFLGEYELEIHHDNGLEPTVWKKSALCYGDWIADLRKVKIND